MDILQLKDRILMMNIPKNLYFYGDEYYLIRQYVNKIASALLLPVNYLTMEDCLIKNTSSMSEQSLDVIWGYDKRLESDRFNKIFILETEDQIKECKKLDNCIEFKKQRFEVCKIYATMKLKEAGITVDDTMDIRKDTTTKQIVGATIYGSLIDELIEMCDCNLSFIMNEIDKIIAIGQDSAKQLFEFMYKKGFSDYRQVNVFSVLEKIYNQTAKLWEIQKIDNFFGAMTLLKNKIIERGVYSDRLITLLKLCSDLTLRLQDGTIDSEVAMNYFIMKVL